MGSRSGQAHQAPRRIHVQRRDCSRERLCTDRCRGWLRGTDGRTLFHVAQRAYADVGFSGEEQKHHQGGAIGYRSREWIAHPASEETVQERQAFAWNPSITGTKVEDTALLTERGIELISSSPGWPTLEAGAAGILGI